MVNKLTSGQHAETSDVECSATNETSVLLPLSETQLETTGNSLMAVAGPVQLGTHRSSAVCVR